MLPYKKPKDQDPLGKKGCFCKKDGILSHRLLYKEVVEVRSNNKKSYFWWFGDPACGNLTGSNQTEKGQGRVSARLAYGKREEWAVWMCGTVECRLREEGKGLVWGKREEWAVECVVRLQIIGLMVVILMSYSRVVSVVLVLWEVGSILGNGYEIWGQNSIKGKFQ